jgi:large subunit ribosomal protein L36e
MPRHTANLPSRGNLAYGLEKGHKTTKAAPIASQKISRRKGHQSARVKFVRDVVRETAGFAPYEKRCMELLRVSKDKRALKFCKKKLGTYLRGKRKRSEMQDVIQSMSQASN